MKAFNKTVLTWICIFLAGAPYLQAAITKSPVTRIEPAFWWVGMKNPKLQVLLQGPGIGGSTLTMAQYAGVTISDIKKVSSPNYLFVYLTIDPSAKPGNLTFILTGKAKGTLVYELKARDARTKAQGYSQADVMYLIMPDRFANGNPANDSVAGMLEQGPSKKPFGRHGGDVEGITKNLDYFNKLGITTLWLNPVQENDMATSSYHGYAITDFYRADRHFGDNAAYLDFIQKAHEKGLKVVMDMVMNHMGTNHYWFKDMPDSTFINFWPKYTPSNFRASAQADPYASEYDQKQMAKGWFDNTMADINGANPLVADYMIQSCIWWIEHGCIDDIRMDTYPYPDKFFMNQWASRIINEYPKLNLVGEVWVDNVALAAYFVKNQKNYNSFNSTEPTIFDFPLRDAIVNGLNDDKADYSNGLVKVYNTLSLDFVYQSPEQNTIFVNNHDMSRTVTALKGNANKTKMALAMLLTLRGKPQLYYGEEWNMPGDGKVHPDVRKNFKGGWAKDTVDYFTGKNVSAEEQDMFAYYQRLLQWRRTSTVVHNGKLTQFVPEKNVYVYFRHTPTAQVMVIINNDTAKTTSTSLPLARYAERLKFASKTGMDIISGSQIDLSKDLMLEPKRAYIIELPVSK